MTARTGHLPTWLIWQPRPFPDTNLLLLTGRRPTLVDGGFVGHAEQAAAWVRAHTDDLALVVNTHWHAGHVGANSLLQAGGAHIAASGIDAAALARPDPGCCTAEYLDQPVAPYTVDEPLTDGQLLRLGDASWQVVATPGHTPGHLSLWQPDQRLLILGDAVSDYDVGWVNIALDGPDTAATALASLQRLAELNPRVLLPAHGPIPHDPAAAIAAGLRRARRLVDDPAGAVRYGARRILAFAVMIRNGIPVRDIEPYLHARAWVTDAARLLDTTGEDFAAELVDSMLRGGALISRDGRLHATADHTPSPRRRCACRSPPPGRRTAGAHADILRGTPRGLGRPAGCQHGVDHSLGSLAQPDGPAANVGRCSRRTRKGPPARRQSSPGGRGVVLSDAGRVNRAVILVPRPTGGKLGGWLNAEQHAGRIRSDDSTDPARIVVPSSPRSAPPPAGARAETVAAGEPFHGHQWAGHDPVGRSKCPVTVDITPSRAGLRDTDRTLRAVRNVLDACPGHLLTQVQADLEAATTPAQAVWSCCGYRRALDRRVLPWGDLTCRGAPIREAVTVPLPRMRLAVKPGSRGTRELLPYSNFRRRVEQYDTGVTRRPTTYHTLAPHDAEPVDRPVP